MSRNKNILLSICFFTFSQFLNAQIYKQVKVQHPQKAVLIGLNTSINNKIDYNKFYNSYSSADEYYNVVAIHSNPGFYISYYQNRYDKRFHLSKEFFLFSYKDDIKFIHIEYNPRPGIFSNRIIGGNATQVSGKHRDVYMGFATSISTMFSKKYRIFMEAGIVPEFLIKGTKMSNFNIEEI
jgi:hypothetical protein